MKSIERRLKAIEEKAYSNGLLGHMTDEELEARILELASALEAENDLDPVLAERLKAMGWVGSDARH